MWFFSIKQKSKRSIVLGSRLKLEQLLERNHIHELDKNDAELRVWLPELCKQALDEITETSSITGSRYLRELFVVYLYGEHELLRMRKYCTGIYFEPPPIPEASSSDIRYSRSPAAEVVPGLGKNIVAIKLFLPERIKKDLKAMANKVDVQLSTFVREILISHLLGHTLWQERLRSWIPVEETIGKQWEEGTLKSEYVDLVDGKRADGTPESDPELYIYKF